VVVPGSSGSLVVFLSKALFGDWTFSKIKTQDLAKVWRRFSEVEVSSPLMLLVYNLEMSFWRRLFEVKVSSPLMLLF
jgi:hypothetical protein